MGPPLAGPDINNKDNYYGVLVKLILILFVALRLVVKGVIIPRTPIPPCPQWANAQAFILLC